MSPCHESCGGTKLTCDHRNQRRVSYFLVFLLWIGPTSGNFIPLFHFQNRSTFLLTCLCVRTTIRGIPSGRAEFQSPTEGSILTVDAGREIADETSAVRSRRGTGSRFEVCRSK